MLEAIAAEYRKGRLLFIGTTDIDAGRPVIWNMGEIAASRQPGALDLFRKILLASAAIPAFFPPVLIDVEVNGRRYREMHVDGGTFTQLFLYPAGVSHTALFHGIKPRPVRAWLIRNGLFHPFWADVRRGRAPPGRTRRLSPNQPRRGPRSRVRMPVSLRQTILPPLRTVPAPP
jgi:predicted acylesterase/phospholipase RssA